MKYTQITSVAKAFKARGIGEIPTPNSFPVIDRLKNYMAKHHELIVSIEAVNEGWVPDYNDMDQYKYELWLNVVIHKDKKGNVTGSGLALPYVGHWHTDTNAGARLTFASQKQARHFWKHFQPLCEEVYLIK
jgi:hypothetical protein